MTIFLSGLPLMHSSFGLLSTFQQTTENPRAKMCSQILAAQYRKYFSFMLSLGQFYCLGLLHKMGQRFRFCGMALIYHTTAVGLLTIEGEHCGMIEIAASTHLSWKGHNLPHPHSIHMNKLNHMIITK